MNRPLSPDSHARFTHGSTMRHVLELTITGSIGLMAIFAVDFLSLFYISRLGDNHLTAGVGYATTVLFVGISFNIGLMIAGTALVSRYIGAGEHDLARRFAGSSLVIAALFGVAVSFVLLVLLGPMLDALGASGLARDTAARFLWITLPANTLMAAGMMLSGLLRAVGDARRAMQVTLFGGIVTALADPLLIFGLGLGTDGAAYATVVSRIVFTFVGFRGLVRVHRAMRRPRGGELLRDAQPFFEIAIPAMLTNVATPVGAMLLVSILAPFGPDAIAANTILDRLIPLAFGVIFALSGAIGPIMGQNLGARRFDRIRQALRDALLFCVVYTVTAWLVILLFRAEIAALFGVGGDTARYVVFFCLVGGLAWIFVGLVLVANAAFNNLGFALYSTAFNWGRATIGIGPFAWFGARQAGVEGAMTGVVIGSALFGLSAVIVAFRTIRKLEARSRA